MANGFGRNFLLLQGPHGPFFRQLGQLLERTGAAAWRVGFNGGDAFFWGKAITCLGLPFYSGWGLTYDRHELQRRQARPDILGLIHACLIEYPRYFDPMSKLHPA